MDTVPVAGAIIVRNGRVLAAHRTHVRSGSLGWEFPGGKIEAGETAEQALRREVAEELGIRLSTVWFFDTVIHEYDSFTLAMDCFVCYPVPGEEPRAVEHDELRWVGRDELAQLDWLPADRKVALLLGASWDEVFASEHL